MRRVGIAFLAVVALLALAVGVATLFGDRLFFAPAEGFTQHEPDARYEALFPYYVELCAVSQLRPLTPELPSGGSPGHAAMYLKGACRDTDAPFPKLRRCRHNATDADDPEHGAGVSVNRWFRNVNWVAVSGRSMFWDGGLAPGERVTRARFDQVAREAIESGAFRGVELWQFPHPTPDPTLFDFVSTRSTGTDFALRLGRSGLCGRLPVEPEMMDEIIHFLNDLNREYATGAVDFEWNGYHDNCVHTVRNALAAASVWDPISVRETRLLQLFHLAVPANEAINLAALGTLGPVDDYGAVFADDAMRHALLEFGWLPTRHGAVLVSLPVRAENELFDTTARILIFQGPATRRVSRQLYALLDDPRFTDLDANLAHFEQVYRGILAKQEARDPFLALRGDRYRRVQRRYVALIESELAELQQMRSVAGEGPGETAPSAAADRRERDEKSATPSG